MLTIRMCENCGRGYEAQPETDSPIDEHVCGSCSYIFTHGIVVRPATDTEIAQVEVGSSVNEKP